VRKGSELLAAEIIDFKTESSNSSSSVEEKEQRYETQMAAYRRVIGSSLRVKNVTSRLVFL
jgi:ATP-dependent exoDNAse (exonuclease V) beta subunit